MKWCLLIALAVTFALYAPGAADVVEAKVRSYEIVLVDDQVEFRDAKAISLDVVLRNTWDEDLNAIEVYSGLTLVWDRKEYKCGLPVWNGPEMLGARRAMTLTRNWAECARVPADCLKPGRHTVSIKDNATESNRLTIFIEDRKERDRQHRQ